MVRRLSILTAALLAASSPAARAACVELGGYPFSALTCLHSADITAAFNLSPGPLPPQNAQGDGAGFGKPWLDTSTAPSTTLRVCKNASGCSTTYTSSDWTVIGTLSSTGQWFASGLGSGAIRTISTGATDNALVIDQTVYWNSNTNTAKTENLLACAAGNNGQIQTFKDEKGNATTYNVTLTASGGTTIEGSSAYAMAFSRQSTTVQCDGPNANWNVQ